MGVPWHAGAERFIGLTKRRSAVTRAITTKTQVGEGRGALRRMAADDCGREG